MGSTIDALQAAHLKNRASRGAVEAGDFALMDYGMPVSLQDAKRVMQAAEEEAAKNRWRATITIVDSSGHLVMQHRMDQANIGSILLSRLKAETAINFRRDTKAFQDSIEKGGLHMRLLAAENLLPLEGGCLLIRENKVIGTIGVSGMASHEDRQVAEAGSASL